jgi:hypothetical protein
MYKLLDTVARAHDTPEAGLRRGDLGAVMRIYALDSMDVEIATASDHTPALLTGSSEDARRVDDRGPTAAQSLISLQGLNAGSSLHSLYE